MFIDFCLADDQLCLWYLGTMQEFKARLHLAKSSIVYIMPCNDWLELIKQNAQPRPIKSPNKKGFNQSYQLGALGQEVNFCFLCIRDNGKARISPVSLNTTHKLSPNNRPFKALGAERQDKLHESTKVLTVRGYGPTCLNSGHILATTSRREGGQGQKDSSVLTKRQASWLLLPARPSRGSAPKDADPWFSPSAKSCSLGVEMCFAWVKTDERWDGKQDIIKPIKSAHMHQHLSDCIWDRRRKKQKH